MRARRACRWRTAAADTLFYMPVRKNRFDAIVCMYHDQGHVPLSSWISNRAWNVRWGCRLCARRWITVPRSTSRGKERHPRGAGKRARTGGQDRWRAAAIRVRSPRAFLARCPGILLGTGRIEFAFRRVDAVQDHAHFIADRELASRAPCPPLCAPSLIGVLVAGEYVDGDQPSTYRSVSSTKTPYFAVEMNQPWKSSPTRPT